MVTWCQVKSLVEGCETDPEFIFSVLGIHDHSVNTTSQYRYWFSHFRQNFKALEGDVLEFGVYKGASLLSLALLAKRLGSKKEFYGFDTFEGFPSDGYSPKDLLSRFTVENGYDRIQIDHSLFLQDVKKINERNISCTKDSALVKNELEELPKQLYEISKSAAASDVYKRQG